MTENDTPEYMSPAAAIAAHTAATAGQRAVEALRDKPIVVADNPDAPRQFLSPQHPNSKWLVVHGEVRKAPASQSGVLGVEPALERRGDVWAVFASGICSAGPEDTEVLDWLLAHSGDPDAHQAYHVQRKENARNCGAPIGLCRESGPDIAVWAELKAGQIPTARRAASISPEIDVDAYMNRSAPQSKLNTGTGARMAASAEANENAARERAAGNRNNS